MISFVMSLVLSGGFYDWSVTVTGVCILLEILLFYQRKKPIYQKKKTFITWIPALLFVWIIGVSFWALDGAGNLLGILRGAVLLFWMYLCFQMEPEEKEKIFALIPKLGAGMVCLGILSLAKEDFAARFWLARRFGGFFQYPNTCALFLEIGLVLQVEILSRKQENGREKTAWLKDGGENIQTKIFKEHMIEMAVIGILLIGLFFTGCRSVLLLFLGWAVYKAIQSRALRKPFIIVTIGSMLLAYGYGFLMGDEQNIARIFTLFEANSTIYGRILYAIDALGMAKTHPLGLGYTGYFYYQPAVQTGVYTTRFIHNDWLQILVDYGIPALILEGIYLGYQLWKGRQSRWQKELLVLILTASLADFHLQYLNLLMVLILCLDLGEKEGIKKRKEIRENYFFLSIGIVAGIYVTVAFGAHYFGNSGLALKLVPFYTEAQIEVLQKSTNKEDAVTMADEILSHNTYVSQAYHIKAYAAAMEEEFGKAVENMEQALALKRYDVESYRTYDDLFEEMIKKCNNTGRMQEREMLKKKKEELPEKLAALEQETHPLAFKLRDVPLFRW